MIGARDDAHALKEAQRSLTRDTATPEKLERWNGTQYQAI
jgi:hypothetical protein